jgi:hypothetical protein
MPSLDHTSVRMRPGSNTDGRLIMPTSDPKIKDAKCGSLQIVGVGVLSLRRGEMEQMYRCMCQQTCQSRCCWEHLSSTGMLRWRHPLTRWFPFTFAGPRREGSCRKRGTSFLFTADVRDGCPVQDVALWSVVASTITQEKRRIGRRLQRYF